MRWLWLLLCCTCAQAAEYSGALRWGREVTLGVPVTGVVLEVAVRPGARVRAGEALLRLDPRGFQARLAEARARVAGALPEREEAQRELERARSLFEQTVLSRHELRLAEIAAARAEAELLGARAEQVQAELDLEHSVLRAPFAGVVAGLAAEVGQAVVTRANGVPLLDLVERRSLLCRIVLPAERIGHLALGQSATVRVAGEAFQGKIAALHGRPLGGAAGEPRYGVDVRFEPGEGHALYPGLPAQVELP